MPDYYKNVEVAKIYNVSNVTVLNWIEAALEKRNQLQLHLVKNKYKILKNDHNYAEMERLKNKGLVHRNKIHALHTKINPDFYEFLTDSEIIQIFHDLEYKKSIDSKYKLYGPGGDALGKYLQEHADFSLKETRDLINTNYGYIVSQVEEGKKVNLIDIGLGYIEATVLLATKLAREGYLNKLFIFISGRELVKYCQQIVSKLTDMAEDSYGVKIEYELIFLNIESSEIWDSMYRIRKNKDEINIFTIQQGVFGNVKNQNRLMESLSIGLQKDDLLIICDRVKSNKNKTVLKPSNISNFMYQWILVSLGIETDKCELIGEYNNETETRVWSFVLDKDYFIEGQVAGLVKKIDLFKGEKISVVQHKFPNIRYFIDDLSELNLKLVNYSLDKNEKDGCFILKRKID